MMIPSWWSAALIALSLFYPLVALGEQPERIVSYSAEEDFADVRDNLELAIIDQGLVINNVMHIGEMLARTGADLGYKQLYLQADSLSFCSARLSYLMMQIDPRNIAVCPYTISVYVTVAEPEKVYVSYQIPDLSGDGDEFAAKITQLLDTIARAAIED